MYKADTMASLLTSGELAGQEYILGYTFNLDIEATEADMGFWLTNLTNVCFGLEG